MLKNTQCGYDRDVLFGARIVENLYDLLDSAVGGEFITANSDSDRVLLECARQSANRLWPCGTD